MQTRKNEEKRQVNVRFGKGEINAEAYNDTITELNQEISEIEHSLEKVSTKKSNLENAAHKAAVTACKLGDMWAYGTFGNRQKIQNLVFPEGITWNGQKLENLTNIENEAFRLIRSISDNCERGEQKKEEIPLDFSYVVDYMSKLSNLFEDFKKLDDFAQHIENQGE